MRVRDRRDHDNNAVGINGKNPDVGRFETLLRLRGDGRRIGGDVVNVFRFGDDLERVVGSFVKLFYGKLQLAFHVVGRRLTAYRTVNDRIARRILDRVPGYRKRIERLIRNGSDRRGKLR